MPDQVVPMDFRDPTLSAIWHVLASRGTGDATKNSHDAGFDMLFEQLHQQHIPDDLQRVYQNQAVVDAYKISTSMIIQHPAAMVFLAMQLKAAFAEPSENWPKAEEMSVDMQTAMILCETTPLKLREAVVRGGTQLNLFKGQTNLEDLDKQFREMMHKAPDLTEMDEDTKAELSQFVGKTAADNLMPQELLFLDVIWKRILTILSWPAVKSRPITLELSCFGYVAADEASKERIITNFGGEDNPFFKSMMGKGDKGSAWIRVKAEKGSDLELLPALQTMSQAPEPLDVLGAGAASEFAEIQTQYNALRIAIAKLMAVRVYALFTILGLSEQQLLISALLSRDGNVALKRSLADEPTKVLECFVCVCTQAMCENRIHIHANFQTHIHAT